MPPDTPRNPLTRPGALLLDPLGRELVLFLGNKNEKEKYFFCGFDLMPLTLGPEKSGSEVRAVARAFTTEQAKRACFFGEKEQ